MRRMLTVGAGAAVLFFGLACSGETTTDAMVPPATDAAAPAPGEPATDAPAPDEGKAGKGGKQGKKAH